jgi:hypothetical protein
VTFFAGVKKRAVRVVVSALLLACFATQGGAVLVDFGAVLIVWAAALTLTKQRVGGESHTAGDRHMYRLSYSA